MRQLVLITGGFPFGKGEAFLETELPYLAQKFDRITLLAINPTDEVARKTPKNCELTQLHTHLGMISKFKALRYLWSKPFRQEIKIIRTVYKLKLNKPIIVTLLLSLFRAQKIQKVLAGFTPSKQIVFYSYWTDDAAIALALLKQQHPQLKTVCRVHRWDVYFHVSPLNFLPFRHLIAEQMNAVFPISAFGKSYIADHWKIKKTDHVITTRLGVKPQQLLSPNKEFIVVSCSNLIPLKRVHLIIAALSQIKNQNITWIHFGEGPEKARLVQLAQEQLGANIRWEFKGQVPNAKILDLYGNYRPSVFINVSSSEGVPVSIMEAMSFGIPCIAMDVGGVSEIVSNDNGVLLSADARIEAIKDALLLFMDEQQHAQRSKNAFSTWESTYNAEINYPLFAEEIAAL